MKASTLAMPAALVLSSLILAIGWNLGRVPAGPPAEVATTPNDAAPPVVQRPALAPDPSPEPPGVVTQAMRERAVDNARHALEGWRSRLREQCWDPAVARAPEPSSVTVEYYLSFSPEGQLLATGLIENRRAFRSDVSQCLRGIVMDLRIPAPGLPMQVQVPFTLP